MAKDLEARLRRALHTVDHVDVDSADPVLERVDSRLRARARNRNVVVGGAAVGLVALAVLGLATVISRDVDPNDPLTAASPAPTAPAVDTAPPTVESPPIESVPVESAPVESVPPADTALEASSWQPIAPSPEGAGWELAAVWMGDEAFVLGGQAYAYDPAADSWRALARFPATWTPLDACQDTPATCIGKPIGESDDGWRLVDPIVVWTGHKVLIVGGDSTTGTTRPPANCRGLGCYPNLTKSAMFGYDPAGDAWQSLAAPPWFVNERSPHAWTGSELLVWPWDIDDNPDPAYAYSPTENTWRQLPDVPIAPRQNAASVWTGTEWIVWGGGDDDGEFGDGAAYDPATDTWRLLAEAPITPRKSLGVWTGREMVTMAGSVGGGTTMCCGGVALSDGAAYDPATDTWRVLDGTVGHPGFQLLWADDVLVMFAKGGAVVYDPVAEAYLDVCCEGSKGLAGSTHVWTGSEVISFGSYTDHRGGGIFTPP